MQFQLSKTLTRPACALLLAAACAASGAVQAAGTSLSVVFGEATIACKADGSGADVAFAWTVTSTGSADSAVMTGQVDGGGVFALPGIASGNVTAGGGWTFAGRMKTSDGSYSTVLANGTHSLTVCATQSGANGNNLKMACETQTVTVNCQSADPCANSEVFGEVIANKNLCSANGHINIQYRGNFGPQSSLYIEGPNGFTRNYAVDRAGDSCNYHYNWDPNDNNGGAGSYGFTVNGNAQSPLVFSADLSCTTGGNPHQ